MRLRLPLEPTLAEIALATVAIVNKTRPGWLHWLARELTLELADRASPDLTWIAPDLAIGGRVLTDEWPAIASAGVQAVVDCRLEASDPSEVLADLGINFLRLPTPDSSNFTPGQVAEGVAWIERQWADRRKVLVHCQAGKGRSVLLGGAALTTRGMSPDEVLSLIRARRPIVTPTPGQISRLRAFAEGHQLPLPLE